MKSPCGYIQHQWSLRTEFFLMSHLLLLPPVPSAHLSKELEELLDLSLLNDADMQSRAVVEITCAEVLPVTNRLWSSLCWQRTRPLGQYFIFDGPCLWDVNLTPQDSAAPAMGRLHRNKRQKLTW
ncbi:hypothetical protein GN956_G25773 [Arapaima gigas]